MTPEALPIVGRKTERERIQACLRVGRNVLLEGPVGVGKTVLALAVAKDQGRPVFRIDGDSRYTEQKLVGGFDPPVVIKSGYGEEAFIPGPLVQAMREGGVLLLNELNRFPEGVQNVLLPAVDEGVILVPRLGEVHAHRDFRVVATQNPREYVATSHLSEAILDRFELIALAYQSEAEELEITQARVGSKFTTVDMGICARSVALARATRGHPRVRRGASVRAAIAVAEIAHALLEGGAATTAEEALSLAAAIGLANRVELLPDLTETQGRDPLRMLLDEVGPKAGLGPAPVRGEGSLEKKKTH
ncbi:MAG TPA: MoxR family ATPase [Bdellovibrionota bacterium]|nr:MoxR family ATPase [Bdellovibrionota bacterium]